MKTKFILFTILIFNVCFVCAQSDYSSYLNKALEKLEAGDCASARKFYNVYTDLTGESKKSIEAMIAECGSKIVGQKSSYRINDKLVIDGKIYRVAHTEDKGTHGFAICDMGSGPITDEMINSRKLPTKSEFEIIIKIIKKLKLAKANYWISDRCSNDRCEYFAYGYSSWSSRCDSINYSHGILLIYRF